jgi:hypothetical protein
MKRVDSNLLTAVAVLLLTTNIASAQNLDSPQGICQVLSGGQATLRDGTLVSGGLAPVRAISGAKGEAVEMSIVAAGLAHDSKCEFRVELEIHDVGGQVIGSKEGVLSGSSKELVFDRPFSPARDRPRETVLVGSTVRTAKTSSGCTCGEVLGLLTVLAIYDQTTGKTVEITPGNLLLGTSFSAPFLTSE